MAKAADNLDDDGGPVCHPIWGTIPDAGDLKSEKMKTISKQVRKTNLGLRSAPAPMRDLPTIASLRTGALLRRNGPVPGILAAPRSGAIMDKSGRPRMTTSKVHKQAEIQLTNH